jgi:hypothetical protein
MVTAGRLDQWPASIGPERRLPVAGHRRRRGPSRDRKGARPVGSDDQESSGRDARQARGGQHDDTKHARIVLQSVGPVPTLQLRHVPSDSVFRRSGVGPDVAARVEQFRAAAERRGYTVEPGYSVEDWNPRIMGALRS